VTFRKEEALAEILILILFPALIIAAAVTDIFTMTISNWISIILVAAFAATAVLTGMSGNNILLHFAAGGLVLAVGFTMFCFGLVGGGDAKFLAAIALWFGFQQILPLIFYTAIIGGPLCIAMVYARQFPLPNWVAGQEWAERLHSKETGAPYGVAIAAAALVLFAETPAMKAIGV
jgi:prepilin peptidase CpaA